MESNLYQAPASEIITPESENSGLALYVIAPWKFTLLFWATLGIYDVYWNFKNWQSQKDIRQKEIQPVGRALFSIFFFASLLKTINSENEGKAKPLPVALMATLYILSYLISTVSDRAAANMDTFGVLDLVSLALLPISWAVMLKAQKAINLSQGDEHGLLNNRLTLANGIWILLGAALWGLILLGLASGYFPEQTDTFLDTLIKAVP
ncbi:hypothetical protein [Alcanivorax sp.]|jgi:hypothetical protein|uniref:hypothetical protein n=1 Tax=Alcanivorax sp. TaxID=1872427 RepID=UPI0032D99CC4